MNSDVVLTLVTVGSLFILFLIAIIGDILLPILKTWVEIKTEKMKFLAQKERGYYELD